MKIRRISLLLFLLAGILSTSYFGIRSLFLFLILGIALSAIALIYYQMLPNSMPCSLEIPASTEKGKRITGYLHIIQDGRLPIFHGAAKVHFRSIYYKQEDTIHLDITLMGQEEGIAAFYIDTPYVGMIEVTLEEAVIYGLFGLKKKTIVSSMEKHIMVMPETREIDMDMIDLGNLDPEGEELRDSIYGYDPGIYQGIRPYRQGDSMKYIHWKLTGKTDELMVKELGIPSGREPRLYLETGLPDLRPTRIDRLMEDYFSLSMALLSFGRPHIICWKNDGKTPEEYTVENISMLEELLEPLFRIEFWQDKREHKDDTWIYYMSHDESLIYGFYHVEEGDYLEQIQSGERLWNESR